MPRFLNVLAAATLAFSVSACDSGDTAPSSPTASGATSAAPSATPDLAAATRAVCAEAVAVSETGT
ncbi:MAG TPA: hypothetical protein VGD43_16975, partial [Micromonospora sp.]